MMRVAIGVRASCRAKFNCVEDLVRIPFCKLSLFPQHPVLILSDSSRKEMEKKRGKKAVCAEDRAEQEEHMNAARIPSPGPWRAGAAGWRRSGDGEIVN